MPAERFFYEGNIGEGQQIFLEEQEFHHLVHVMRAENGDSIELVNGKGVLASGNIDRIEKKRAHVSIKTVFVQKQSSFAVILAQAIPRQNRLDFILEKGTELGMSQLWLFPAKQGERKDFTPHQLERMRSVMIAAMKQCGRLYLPELVIKPPLSKWEPLKYFSFFGDVHSEAPPFLKIWQQAKSTFSTKLGVLFFIGPESGFNDDEIHTMRQLNANGVKLHSNILRTDTAGLAALTLIDHLLLSDAVN